MNTQIGMALSVLKERQPLNLVAIEKLFTAGKKVGLVIVDEVNGFCTPGAGFLAPPAADPMIDKMVEETDLLAKGFEVNEMPILVLQEAHEADKPEPPYPPHCINGSGEEILVPALNWLYSSSNVTVIEKGCINGVIGAVKTVNAEQFLQVVSYNKIFEWVKREEIETIVVVGICTDICVLQFVQAMLSARNRDLVKPLKDVVVYTEGCATYDLPIEVANILPAEAAPANGTTANLAHDQQLAHYMGLYLMQMSGAILANSIKL